MNKDELDKHVSFFANPVIGGNEIAAGIIQGRLKMSSMPAEDKSETDESGNLVPAPVYNFTPIENITSLLPGLKDQTLMDDEWKKNRRIKLFNDRSFFARELISKKENGLNDYSKIIEHIHFLEECIKDLKTEHQAYELAKRWHIENASLAERARIAEEDKKYKSN